MLRKWNSPTTLLPGEAILTAGPDADIDRHGGLHLGRQSSGPLAGPERPRGRLAGVESITALPSSPKTAHRLLSDMTPTAPFSSGCFATVSVVD